MIEQARPAPPGHLGQERRLLSVLLTIPPSSAPPPDQGGCQPPQLTDVPAVVVGEFNAGKSAVINALLGDRILDEGVTPTTSRIGLLRHGPAVFREAKGASLEIVTAPVEVLRELNIVDTPGTNAVLREHEALTREFVPRADLVLFVTSADRPFTESERAFLETIRDCARSSGGQQGRHPETSRPRRCPRLGQGEGGGLVGPEPRGPRRLGATGVAWEG
jgi:hypothetical protein